MAASRLSPKKKKRETSELIVDESVLHNKWAKILNDSDQLIGGVVFSSAHFSAAQSILELMPWWALVHGLLQIYKGYATAKDRQVDQLYTPKFYSSSEKRVKSIAQMFSGAYLFEGGLGMLTKGQLLHATTSHLLFFRFAFCAGFEFIAALEDLRRVLWHDPLGKHEAGASPLTQNAYIPNGSRIEIWDALANVFAKGLACAAWTALFYGNPVGYALLAASSLCYAIKYIVPAISFYAGSNFFKKQNSYDPRFKDTPAPSSENNMSLI